MSVLICKNVENEGPGTIEDYLRSENITFRIVELSKGGRVPDSEIFDTLIIMGGPMSVHDVEKYPFLEDEIETARYFMKSGRKVLGICLGAQIMAKALGSRVYPGAQEEKGWLDIELSPEGLRDTCMKSIAGTRDAGHQTAACKVFHWHGETFDIPVSAVRLAGSRIFPNQAFKYGNSAYAFQFHIEVSREMIYDWFRNDSGLKQLQSETETLFSDYHERAVMFYRTFFDS
jgi:GMP synthase-like glutamine amidotransferase